jgi:hypothetical protein
MKQRCDEATLRLACRNMLLSRKTWSRASQEDTDSSPPSVSVHDMREPFLAQNYEAEEPERGDAREKRFVFLPTFFVAVGTAVSGFLKEKLHADGF